MRIQQMCHLAALLCWPSILAAQGLPIGSWQNVSLPAGSACDHVFVNGGRLYALDSGHHVTYESPLGANGLPGAWTQTSGPANAQDYAACALSNGTIYAAGGSGGYASTATEYTRIQTDGTLSSWSSGPSMSFQTADAAAAVANGYLYVAGGWSSSWTFESRVQYAKINSDGGLGGWQLASSTQYARPDAALVAHGSSLYTVGGGRHNYITNTIESANVNLDGSLGSWSVVGSIPQPLFGHASVVIGDMFYLLGGGNQLYGGGWVTETYASRIGVDGTLGPWVAGSPLLSSGYTNAAVDQNRIYALTYGGGQQPRLMMAEVPEPASVLLIALGGLALLGRRR